MLSPEHITDADMDVAVHVDPSTDPDAWQEGAETIEEYFGPGGSFRSEPVDHDGEYVSEGSKDMSISSGSSPEIGSGSGKSKGNGSGNEIGMGTGKVNANVGMSSSGIGGAMNGLNINYSSDQPPANTITIDETYIPRRHNAPHSGFDQQQHPVPSENTSCDSSPPTTTTQPTKHGPSKRPSPTVEIKQPTKSDKMHAELSVPVTPQLGTPFLRGRTTRSTKGAEDMRREMEVKEKELAEIQVKTAAGSLKRKLAAETPVQPRKQPKRAAKDKKK